MTQKRVLKIKDQFKKKKLFYLIFLENTEESNDNSR